VLNSSFPFTSKRVKRTSFPNPFASIPCTLYRSMSLQYSYNPTSLRHHFFTLPSSLSTKLSYSNQHSVGTRQCTRNVFVRILKWNSPWILGSNLSLIKMNWDLRIQFLNFFRVLPLGKVFRGEEALQIWNPYAIFLSPLPGYKKLNKNTTVYVETL
jgi:hypothetical protein